MDCQSMFVPDDDTFIIDGDLGCENETEEVDEDFNQIIVSDQALLSDELSEYILPASFNPEDLLQAMRSKLEVTAIQKESNELIDKLLSCHMARVSDFCKKQFIILTAFMEDLNVTASTPVKTDAICHFYERCNHHQSSQEYLLTSMILFQDLPTYTDAQAHIRYKLTVEVRKFLLQEKVYLFKTPENPTCKRNVTSASKSRIRYVAGYCISKVRYRHLQLQKSKSTKVSIEDQQQYEESTMAINILDALRVNAFDSEKNSAQSETLVDVIRKQNINRGLTSITDDLFFFVSLCEMCLDNLTNEHLHQHGRYLHKQCLDVILSDNEIHEQFLKVVRGVPMESFSFNEEKLEDTLTAIADILNNLTLQVSVMEGVYRAIIEKFVMVMLNQYRKDLLQAFSVEKTLDLDKYNFLDIVFSEEQEDDCVGTCPDQLSAPKNQISQEEIMLLESGNCDEDKAEDDDDEEEKETSKKKRQKWSDKGLE